MGKLKNIEWKNIYYFLCYAIDELQYFVPKNISYEDIQGTHDLLAELLCNAFEVVYSNGYLKEYRREEIVTDKPYGSINIVKSVQTGNLGQGKLVCEVDTLDTNNELNQIIKAAFTVLIDSNKVVNDKINPKLMTKLINYRRVLEDVDSISITREILHRDRDIPEWYKPIITVAKFIIEEWLALDKAGKKRLLYLDDVNRLCRIWEKYVRAFYKKNLLSADVSNPSYTKSGRTNNLDILALSDKAALIIDTKWYESSDNERNNEREVLDYGVSFIDMDERVHKYNEIHCIVMYAHNELHEISHAETYTCNDRATPVHIDNIDVNVNQDKSKIEQDLLDIANRFLQ